MGPGSICKQVDLPKIDQQNVSRRAIIDAPDKQFACAMVRVSDRAHMCGP